jgi:glucose-6-phosphate 1-epimerase
MNLPPGANLAPHSTGGDALTLTTPGGTALIALHGATVISFVPTGGRDLIWLSPKATSAGGKPLRGGIPLCGPWFGPHATHPKGPTHGLMRQRPWTLARVEALAEGRLRAEFALELPAEPALGWVHAASARCTVTVGSTVAVELTLRNIGTTPFLASGALHSYLAVGDVRRTRVEGLDDRSYIDFTNGGVRRRHGAGPVVLDREAARFFLTSDPVRVVDGERTIAVRSWGHGATVVWNPWDATAATMADLGDGWPGFLCVEAANIPDTAVPLPPHHSHHLGTELGMG